MHIDFAINGNIMNFSILIIILYFKVSIIMDPALMPQQLYGYFFFYFIKWEFDFEKVEMVQHHLLK